MTKYNVAITEIVEYLVPVEAENEDVAKDLADFIFLNDERGPDQFFVAVRAREVEGVNLVNCTCDEGGSAGCPTHDEAVRGGSS